MIIRSQPELLIQQKSQLHIFPDFAQFLHNHVTGLLYIIFFSLC